MQRNIGLAVFVLLGLLFLSRRAVAAPQETYPLLSAERASVAVALDREFLAATPNAGPVVGLRSEWRAGVSAAYNLIAPSPEHPKLPHISLAGSATLGLESQQISARLGLRWRVWSGKDE